MRFSVLFFFLITTSNIAQIQIDQQDLPEANQSYFISSTAEPDFDYAESGDNLDWDFSELDVITQRTVDYVTVSGAPFVYQFVFNNPLDSIHLADHATAQEGFSLGEQFSLSDFYAFYKARENAYIGVGFAGTINEIPVPAGSNPVDTIYRLPLNYGDDFEGYSEWFVQIPGVLSYKLKQSRSYEVDGWGSLNTPFDDYPSVLRVRMQTEIIDSISIDALNFSFENPRNITEYQWLAPEMGIPVLKVIENEPGIITTEFLDEETVNISTESQVSMSIFPNPASSFIQVKEYNGPLQVYNMKGQEVWNGNARAEERIDISMLSTGRYSILLENGSTLSFIKH